MILMRGKSGNEVAAIQFALNGVSAFMPKLKVDGIFGPLTHERVRQHQTTKRLKPDGIVGPLTFSELFESVALDGVVRITRTDGKAGIGGGVTSRFSIGPPNLGPQLSPELAAWARAQEAFMKWWAQPVPKPAIPVPSPFGIPTGPFGSGRTQVFQVPPSPAQTANVAFKHEPDEGGNVTIQIQKETSGEFFSRKPRETVAKFTIEWLMLKGRAAELGLEGSVNKKRPADAWSVELEFNITSSNRLALELQRGPLNLKLAGHFAAAVSSELSAEFFLGPKADAEITVIKGMQGSALKIFLSGKAGLKAEYGKEDLPDGREITHWHTPAFAGEASAGIGLVF